MGLLLLAAAALAVSCAVKPSPLSDKEQFDRAREDREALYKDQVPLAGPLSLAEAVARALKYNYDHRQALFEAVLQDKQLEAANMAMLPQIAANAGFTNRSNEQASTSISYRTRQVSLEPSISQEPTRLTTDLSFSWSLLDFGVSYFQAKQQADRTLIAKERRRRVVNNIVKETLTAYWRAAAAERVLPRIDPTLAEAAEALKALEKIEKDQLEPLLPLLEQQKALLQIIGQLRRIQAELSMAKAQLASLVNLPVGENYSLELPLPDIAPPKVDRPLAELEALGLFSRPDLREEVYAERIDRQSVNKELLRLVPGVTLLGNLSSDSNKYLLNNSWAEAGAKAAFNLVGSLLTGPKQVAAAKSQVNVDRMRRLALTVAALVQINVGFRQYEQAYDTFQDAKSVSGIDERIVKAVTDGEQLEAESPAERVKRMASALISTLDRDRSLAETYKALGNLNVSLGCDLVRVEPEKTELPELILAVKDGLDPLLQGRFPTLPPTFPDVAGQNPAPAAP